MLKSARATSLVISLGIGCFVSAQSLEQWTSWGDKAMAREEYYGATRFYAGALAVDGGRMSLQWKQAEAARLSHQYDVAAEFYEKVVRKDLGRSHPEASRWLAEMRMCQGKYAEAEEVWSKVVQREKDKRSFISLRAANGLAGCTMAKDTAARSAAVRIEHLPQPVNTYDSEFGARIGPDSMLYFASLRGDVNAEGELRDTLAYRTGLFRTPSTGSTWQAPVPLSSSVNSNGDNANVTWTLDGKWVLFTRCVSGSPCRLHIAPVSPTGIGEARVLPGIGDSLHSTQPMVVRWLDREMLLFVSDRPGGEGGSDIWQAELFGDEAKYVYPLGRPLNTPGNERCPWYDTVTNTVWFSSDFLPGYGGYDIFSAAFGDDVFANPVNAGRPINSPANDLYPVYDPINGTGWLTSNRVGSFAAKGETCCNDLYRFHFPKERSTAVAQLPEPVPEPESVLTSLDRLHRIQDRFPLALYFHNDDPEPRSWAKSTAQTYEEAYRRYDALRPDYQAQNLDRSGIQRFFVERVDRGYAELSELAAALWTVLEEGRSITLRTRGHASPLARSDYNENLSMRRIASLRNHLLSVDGSRLAPYLNATASNGATLTVQALPFGEQQAVKGVSDDLRDTPRSVYSVEAASERRIEITALELLQRSGDNEEERQVIQLGELKQNMERSTRFTVRNAGDKPMLLLHSEADCGCTTAELPSEQIPPGGSATIEVKFNGHAIVGALRRNVVVDTDGLPKRFLLVIEGEVIP